MRSLVIQPVRRLMIVALAGLCVVSTAAVASAQDPPPPPTPQQPAAPAQPDPLRFTTGPVMVYKQIKPDLATAFEAAWAAIRQGLTASGKPELQQQVSAVKIFRVNAAGTPADAPRTYVFYVEQVPATGVTFDPIKLLYESGAFERAKADEIYATIKDAYMQIAPWPLVAIGG
ncbi:MAG: hypothetical protein WD690_01920 [Vicinamibacterales bacterium]